MSNTDPARFTFFKLTVADLDRATGFFEAGFGMTRTRTIETDGFRENIMTGADGSATIVLFHYKDGRSIDLGTGYGPIGMVTRDLDADLARVIEAGGKQKGESVALGASRIAIIVTPDGHEIEMIQPAAPVAAAA